MIKLKITIPTYNRPDYIQRQVRDLLPQLREGVSLIVYDNCSDVPVESYFSDAEKNHFTIVRNKLNIGGAANIGKCLSENGDSGWIWLLGDDDKIADDAVDTILKTITTHKECCYINFQQKITRETDDFIEFLNYMKILGAFGTSFFQSACLFNMDKLRPYVRYYFEFLSSWVGQIAMVIKFLEDNRSEHCFFTTQQIVIDVSVGGWSHLDIIPNSLILVDRFLHLKPIMRSTLFKALGDMNYTNLAQESASWRIKRRYSHYIMNKLGRFNVYRFNLITYLQYMLSVLLTKEKFAKIRTITAGIYNKKIKKQ